MEGTYTAEGCRRAERPWLINLGVCGLTFMFLESLGGVQFRNWIQCMFKVCNCGHFPSPSSLTPHQLVVYSNNTRSCLLSPRRAIRRGKSNGRWAPTLIWGCLPTIMFMLGRVFLLNLSETALAVGGPRWQPVAARLRISPPQGQDYNIIKMMSSKCVAEGI